MVALLATAALSSETAQVIDAGEREILPFVVISPGVEGGALTASALIDLLAARILLHTAYAPSPVEPAAIRDCEGALECILPRLGATRVEATADRTAPPTRALLVSKVPVEGEDVLSVSLFELSDRSEQFSATRLRVASASDAERVIDAALADPVWLEAGSIRLGGLPSGAEIRIDDRTIGQATKEMVLVRGLLPGPRALEIVHPRFAVATTRLTVEAGTEVDHVMSLALLPSTGREVRAASVWAGAIGIGIGAALGAAAVLDGALSDRRTCLAVPESASCSWRWARFPDQELLADRSGVPLFPLAASLALGSAALSAGALWWGDEDEVPWLGAILGVALGAGVYVLATQLEPDPAARVAP